jgi:hypothetical protein
LNDWTFFNFYIQSRCDVIFPLTPYIEKKG